VRLHDVPRDRARGFRHAAPPSSDDEDDLLDRAWGLTPVSRLSCQAIVQDEPLKVEIPKYTINYAREGQVARVARRRKQSMKWTDSRDIAIALTEAHPDVDPQFVALHRPAIAGLRTAGLSDDPERSGEKILEANPDGLDRQADKQRKVGSDSTFPRSAPNWATLVEGGVRLDFLVPLRTGQRWQKSSLTPLSARSRV